MHSVLAIDKNEFLLATITWADNRGKKEASLKNSPLGKNDL
jgi:hypothetical protein